MIQEGLIGFGYWGPNTARNVQDSPDHQLRAICDIVPESLEQMGRWAFRPVRERFTWASQEEQLFRTFDAVISGSFVGLSVSSRR